MGLAGRGAYPQGLLVVGLGSMPPALAERPDTALLHLRAPVPLAPT